MIPAVGYIRVSTDEQSRGGLSLEMQDAKIKAYASLEDMDLIEIVADPGISACSIKGRPGIRRVLDMIKNKTVQAVIIYKLDRLARNTIQALQMAELMDFNEVGLHSICEKLDTKSAIGRFFFTLLASLAEMERNIVSERTRDIMARKRENGQATGHPPYGSKVEGKRLVPHPEELAVIQRINELHAAGHTIWGIVDILTCDGLLNRKNKPFGKTQVHTLIVRKVA